MHLDMDARQAASLLESTVGLGLGVFLSVNAVGCIDTRVCSSPNHKTVSPQWWGKQDKYSNVRSVVVSCFMLSSGGIGRANHLSVRQQPPKPTYVNQIHRHSHSFLHALQTYAPAKRPSSLLLIPAANSLNVDSPVEPRNLP